MNSSGRLGSKFTPQGRAQYPVTPKTRYAKSGDFSIAYQVFGQGPPDLLYIPGGISHLDMHWDHPGGAHFMRRLGSFARVAIFDRRGMGLSDPLTEPPSLEDRVDDARAVMDAAGMERAALFGNSEGASLAAYLAASNPERVSSLILYGAFARLSPDPPDYPHGIEDTIIDQMIEAISTSWGEGISLGIIAPSRLADDREREWFGRFERAAVSPSMELKIANENRQMDIRSILHLIQAPTLFLHRTGDFIPIGGARYMSERIPHSRFVELKGEDHWPWLDDPDEVCGQIEEFLTGQRHVPEPDRVLATVLFTDIVGSTERAAALGDRRWRELLDGHERLMRQELDHHHGREIKTMGDGFLATFDGPARGIRCARTVTERIRELGLDLRAGLHTGECELRNGDLGGIAVHIGARVAAKAGAGEVLVSSTVKDLTVGSDIDFADRGVHELKGVPGEWRLYAVGAGGRR